MDEHQSQAINTITIQARKIMEGSYNDVDQIFRLTDPATHSAGIADLAEAFGMMSVKVEAREFALQQTIGQLKQKSDALRESMKLRQVASSLLLWFAISMSFFIFILGVIHEPKLSGSIRINIVPWFSNLFIISQVIIMTILIRKNGYKLSDYGVNIVNARKSASDALIATCIIVVFMVGLKVLLIQQGIEFPGRSFIKVAEFKNTFFWVYFVSAPVQEFILRGVLQSSAERIILVRHRKFWAIVSISLVFGALHTFYSIFFAMVAFGGGLLWGWLFSRHMTLIGPSLSHLLLGFALFLLGFSDIMGL